MKVGPSVVSSDVSCARSSAFASKLPRRRRRARPPPAVVHAQPPIRHRFGQHHMLVLKGQRRSWNCLASFDNVERLVEVGRGSPTGVLLPATRGGFPATASVGIFSVCWTLAQRLRGILPPGLQGDLATRPTSVAVMTRSSSVSPGTTASWLTCQRVKRPSPSRRRPVRRHRRPRHAAGCSASRRRRAPLPCAKSPGPCWPRRRSFPILRHK